MKNYPLKIEALINSPGPHDQVRIREPFYRLEQMGIDCRIHERPFQFNKCIRPHSMVIWQRPLPDSKEQHLEYLQWLRERGCILLIEWDDHPLLFPKSVKQKQELINWAPLRLCHGIHTSSTKLAICLERFNPITFVVENAVNKIPDMNSAKHLTNDLRIFIGNQNRENDQYAMAKGLQQWLDEDEKIKLIIVADKRLSDALPKKRTCNYGILNYSEYREIMSTCHLALLPLSNSIENACKTPIKLMECAAESVATICGPELYGQHGIRGVTIIAKTVHKIVYEAKKLAKNHVGRIMLTERAYNWAKHEIALEKQLPYRMWIYQQIWNHRQKLDQRLVARYKGTSMDLGSKLID